METTRITAFILDDDPRDLELLRRDLEDIPGWLVQVLGFNDWETGRKELTRRAVDVIFLDYLLGQETGLEVLREIRGSGDQRPVIVMTGQGDEQIAAEITRAGADDYLVKGLFNSDTLRRSIEGATLRYQLRREKALLSEQLQQSQKMETIGTLAGGIAHDFNNMLTAIMGYVELALVKSEGREIRKELDYIQTACRQMAELVQRILSFSRRENSGLSLINLGQIIKESDAVLRHTISKQIEVRVKLAQESLMINANASMLHQVLLNLCVNAAEAMRDNGVLTIHAEKMLVDSEFALAHPSIKEGAYIRLEVQDTGEGMDQETRERIFEPFFTTKTLGTRKGTGLGLAVVWQNIAAHNGLINVDSEPGRGTTFKIYLPLTRKDRENIPQRASEGEIPTGSECLLVVDDEKLVRELTGTMLQSLGYTVYSAPDGETAIKTYLEIQDKIGAVLLDISMPRMDGEECLTRLLKIDPDVRVLFSSGHDMAAKLTNLKALGAKGVIQKPYRIRDMARQIRALLDD